MKVYGTYPVCLASVLRFRKYVGTVVCSNNHLATLDYNRRPLVKVDVIDTIFRMISKDYAFLYIIDK